MTFTVVIPLYNKKKHIKAAIDSVLRQSYFNFELLIVDDGSTDGSANIAKNLKDSRLRYIKKEHSGVAATRNRGIEEATSSYIALLDADDWWAPTYLEEMHKAIKNFPENKLFASGRTHVFPKKEVEYTNSYLPKKGATGLLNHFRIISKYLPAINSSSITLNKDYFLEKGGFNGGMRHFEDHECWLRLALEQPIIFVNKPLSYYNKTAQESLSKASVRSSDLLYYVNTILLIKEQLSGEERRAFRKFYQRFAKWSYLKYAPTYSENERLLLQESLQLLLSSFEVKILDKLQKVGIANLYQRVKKTRNGGS
jgi:glycosyltransferase involved in cell wall biosynthesis